jgi:hypothetical protein
MVKGQGDEVRLPESIRGLLLVHWPKQFTVEDEGDDEVAKAKAKAFRRTLQHFAGSVKRIMDAGVTIEQIETALHQMANERKNRRDVDRGAIIERLWGLVHESKKKRVPDVEVGTRPGEDGKGTVIAANARPIAAIRKARGNKAEAIRACPMLGQTVRGGVRLIDTPLFNDECRRVQGKKPAHLPDRKGEIDEA